VGGGLPVRHRNKVINNRGRSGHEFIGTAGPSWMRKAQTRHLRAASGAPTANVNITSSTGTGANGDNVDPCFSPDGTKIAFASNRNGAYNVFICRGDGSNPNTGTAFSPLLVSGVGGERYPAWSPGGTALAYVRSNAIYIRNLTNNIEIELIDGLSNIQNLAYSPDGSRLVFSARMGSDTSLNLYWVTTDSQAIDPTTGKPQMVEITSASSAQVNPHWDPNASGAVIFSSNYKGDFDLYSVTPPSPGEATIDPANWTLLLGNGGDGDQLYPCWLKPGGVPDPNFDLTYGALYSWNQGSGAHLYLLDSDTVTTPVPVFTGVGEQIMPFASPIQDATHESCVYAGAITVGGIHDLYTINIWNTTPPVMGNGITTSLPTVSPQRAFPGSTVTISCQLFDAGSGVPLAPADTNNYGYDNIGVWALLRAADQPVYARMEISGAEGQGPGMANSQYGYMTDNEVELDQQVVDAPTTTVTGTLATVDPTVPSTLGINGNGTLTTAAALQFVQTYGIPMYDDGTHGSAVSGDGTWVCTFVCPSDQHDFYVDIIATDNNGNLPLDNDIATNGAATGPVGSAYVNQTGRTALLRPYAIGYDHVAGFTTRSLDVTRRILLVSEYGCGQKFQAANFGVVGTTALGRYWPVVYPCEHYWISDDVNTNGETETAHTLFVWDPPNNSPPCDQVIKPHPGTSWPYAFAANPLGGAPSASVLTDVPTSSSFTYESNANGFPFAGPNQPDPLAVWRILCRGPLDTATLASYTPLPLQTVTGSPIPTQDGDHMVIWTAPYCGDVFAQSGTLLDSGTQLSLQNLVSSGGRLLVAGQDVGWALTKNGAQTSSFMTNTLHANFVSDAPQDVITNPIFGAGGERNQLNAVAGQNGIEPQLFLLTNNNPVDNTTTGRWSENTAYTEPTALSPIYLNGPLSDFGGDACPNTWFVDDCSPAAGGWATYNYNNGGQTAMVRYIDPATGGRTIYCAFNLESLRNQEWIWPDTPNTIAIVGVEERVRFLTNVSDYFRTGGVEGTVVDTDGVTPMSGINIQARIGTGTNGAIMGQTTTLSDGTYLIKGLSVGDYSLFVNSQQYTADHRPTSRIYGGQVNTGANLNMRLLRFSTGTIYGQVTNPSKQPVNSATVTVTLASTGTNPLTYTGTTDANGNYTDSVPGAVAGVTTGTYVYNVTASASGYASSTVSNLSVTAGVNLQENFQLNASPGTLSGTVTGATSAGGTAVVSGATVTISSGGVASATATTNGAGTYSVSLQAGTYTVTVTASGYQQSSQMTETITSSQTTTANISLTAVPPGALDGSVTVQGSTSPLAGVTISLLVNGSALQTTTSTATSTTDSSGTWNFEFTSVPAGTYDVEAEATGYAAQTLSSITVTSNQTTGAVDFTMQPLHVFVSGISMTSTPFDYSTAVPDAATLLGTPVKMATWDPTAASGSGAYDYYPTVPAKTFLLGRGYFIKLAADVPLTTQGVTASTTGTGFAIPLFAGWNLIGDPFQFSVDLLSCEILWNGQYYNFSNAASAGYVNGSLYTLNFGAYEQIYRLDPYTGYWLRSYYGTTAEPAYLIVPPTALTGRAAAATARVAPTSSTWQAGLQVSGSGGRSASVTFGVGAGGANTYCAADRAAPPTPPTDSWLTMSFPHSDWGRYADNYLTEIKAPGRQLRWLLEIDSGQPGETLTLSWPGLGAALPAGVQVLVQDLQTGTQRSLRSTSSYNVTLNTSGTRQLALVVQPDNDRPQVNSLGYVGGRGGAGDIHFTLTAPLTIDCTVRGLGGSLVRRVVSGQALAAGAQDVPWDGRDENGRPVPDGTYRLEVTGVDDTGVQVRVDATLVHRH
jgi:hypothetical protein